MENNMLGTTVVTQIGILVRDIKTSTKAYADFFGVEMPEIMQTDTLERTNMRYHGKPSTARCKQSFFRVGEACMIELIEPDSGPSEWRDALDRNGEGVHHIAFEIEGMDEKIMRLEQAGISLTQQGDYPGGRYAYLDAKQSLKIVIELLENFKR